MHHHQSDQSNLYLINNERTCKNAKPINNQWMLSPYIPLSVSRLTTKSSKMDDYTLPLSVPEKFLFPFEPYSIQNDFMKALYKALEERKFGIFESPTGTVSIMLISSVKFFWAQDSYRALNFNSGKSNRLSLWWCCSMILTICTIWKCNIWFHFSKFSAMPSDSLNCSSNYFGLNYQVWASLPPSLPPPSLSHSLESRESWQAKM